MSMVYKIQAGATMPTLTVPKVGGGEITIGSSAGWQMVVVYRGKHCPICRTYLKTLDRLLDDFHEIGTEVIAVSGDPQERAESEAAEEGWRIPIGYGLCVDQMRVLGLYISEPRRPVHHQPGRAATDRRYLQCTLRAARTSWRAERAEIRAGEELPDPWHGGMSGR
jgi:hypothetical protein